MRRRKKINLEVFDLAMLLLNLRYRVSQEKDNPLQESNVFLQELKNHVAATKSFVECVCSKPQASPIVKAEMLSLLIEVENPQSWKDFVEILDSRLKQIEKMQAEEGDEATFASWIDEMLLALQERSELNMY